MGTDGRFLGSSHRIRSDLKHDFYLCYCIFIDMASKWLLLFFLMWQIFYVGKKNETTENSL